MGYYEPRELWQGMTKCAAYNRDALQTSARHHDLPPGPRKMLLAEQDSCGRINYATYSSRLTTEAHVTVVFIAYKMRLLVNAQLTTFRKLRLLARISQFFKHSF
jgi:hypothetical protein